MTMTLRKKLLSSFVAIAGVSSFVGLVGSYGMNEGLEHLTEVQSNLLPSVDSVWRINEALAESRSAMRALLLPDLTAENFVKLHRELEDEMNEMQVQLKVYEPLVGDPEETVLFKQLKEDLEKWADSVKAVEPLISLKDAMNNDGRREKNPEEYMKVQKKLSTSISGLDEIYSKTNHIMDKISGFIVELAKKDTIQVEKSVANLRFLLIIVIILAFAISIFAGVVLSNSTNRLLGADPSEISEIIKTVSTGDTSLQMDSNVNFGVYNDVRRMLQGLNEKADQAEAIAKGDLTKEISLLSDRDRLGKSFQSMSSMLREVIMHSNLAANQVAAGSDQVSSASQSLSQGASEQAAAVEEISSSITEISTKVKQNAEFATTASETAQSAQAAAEQGNNQIEVTLKVMNEINNSSREISKIIKVIDDIAFQTNLLALNAAVEAARAGRHGKGFAVVADEVRNLAGRSAKAAKETTELIESSSRKVDSGLLEANKTAESFKDIVKGSLKVASIVRQIADASKEQSAAIIQIASGINQINKVTQGTTASAEEAAAAAEELSGQSQELRRSLSYFKVSAERNFDHSQNSHASRVISLPPTLNHENKSDWGNTTGSSSPQEKTQDHSQKPSTIGDQDFGKYRA